jgi:hypothetical protein
MRGEARVWSHAARLTPQLCRQPAVGQLAPLAEQGARRAGVDDVFDLERLGRAEGGAYRLQPLLHLGQIGGRIGRVLDLTTVRGHHAALDRDRAPFGGRPGDAQIPAGVVLLDAAALGAPRVDALVSLAIAGLIAWTAWDIVRGAARVLTDASVGDPATIAAAARRVPGVRDCHQVRARGMAGFVRVDLHITVDPTLPVVEAHAIAEAVTAAVREQVGGVAEVLVHLGAATPHAPASDLSGAGVV